jgi:DNA polymerase/3'-5' exonuclease PolX
MSTGMTSIASVNERSRDELIQLLKRVSELYNQGGDTWRATSFIKAATAIRRLPDSALQAGVTKSQLTKYSNIGPSTADAILEYIQTGRIDTRMKLAQNLNTLPVVPLSTAPKPFTLTFTTPVQAPISDKDIILNLFKSIHGVGDVTALKWYNQGWRTLDDVRIHISELTHAQQLGITYHSDLQQRIPRDEITRYGEMLNHILPGITWMITGSYRRGCPNSGDIDLLVQTNNYVAPRSVVQGDTDLERTLSSGPTIPFIVERLRLTGSLIGVLGSGDTKFMGIVNTQYTTVMTSPTNMLVNFIGPVRRLDIRLVSKSSWPFALLYFTGSADLNKQMRVRAINKGWTLNEYGMTNELGQLIPVSNELEIFHYLDMDYLEPSERNI